MKFKKGDNIVVNPFSSIRNGWASVYEVKDIANGDLFADQYYILGAGTESSMHDVNIVDQQFEFSLKDTLKKL